MELFYVGDFRKLPNWGCRATGTALRHLLEARGHRIQARVDVETLHWTPWKDYAGLPPRFDGRLPRRHFEGFWRVQRNYPRMSRLFFAADRLLGARYDFIGSTVDESLRQFHRARRQNPGVQAVYAAMKACDAMVINGEGTMIFSTPPRRDVRYTLFLLALAADLGKPSYFLNAMFSECPDTGTDETLVEHARACLASCAAISCRDAQSYRFVKSIVSSARATTIPDALFTWGPRVTSAVGHGRAYPEAIFRFGQEELMEAFDFSQPYIVISGSSSAARRPGVRKDYARMVRAVKELGLPTYLACTCVGDNFLRSVGEMTATPVIPCDIPVLAGAAIVAGAAVLVSGRFHPSIMASLGGAPCVFLGSNSHKTRTLQEVLEYPKIIEFSDSPRPEEIPAIAGAVEHALAQGRAERDRILEVAGKRAAQALRVTELLDGIQVPQQL